MAGYKGCGNGENFVCVPNSEPCPISSVVFDTKSLMQDFNKVRMNGTSNLFY